MAINITLARAKKVVKIPGFSSLEEMLFSSGEEYMEKPATSLLMFRRLIAYAELIALEKFPKEEILESLTESLKVYNSITEHDSLDPTEVEEAVEERLKEEDFNELYYPLIDEISYELLKVFASGVLANHNGYTDVEPFEEMEFKGVMLA
jgi:hypothetical protein